MLQNASEDQFVVQLPDELHKRAVALDDAFPHETVYVHVGYWAFPAGVLGFASNGRVWIGSGAFRPDTMAGLHLIGHELAHLAQQNRMGTSGLGAPEIVDDPSLEAAADRFGAAFADVALLGAAWLPAADAASPRGPVQCSGTWGRSTEDDDDDDDGEEPGPGAANQVATVTRFKDGSNAARAVGGALVGATNVVGGILGGTGAFGVVSHGVGAAAAAGAAMAPALAVLGPIGWALMAVDVALSAKSAASTYSHIKKLEVIHSHWLAMFRVNNLSNPPRASTLRASEWTLNQKNRKLKRKGLGCLPILGSTLNTVYTLGRTIQKRVMGTKGKDRHGHAVVLWQNMMANDPFAMEVCLELLGTRVFNSIRHYSDGHLVLKRSMRSL